MILAILHKELRELLSDRKFWVLFGVALLLTVIAALDGWQRLVQDTSLRSEASRIERETWLNQGEVNPHDAAHFGRYALRDIPTLSAFDPGILDYSGASVWMEAHFQNPASNRRAENRIDSYPLASVTPAWLLSVFVPLVLVILLFGTVVVEKERGTLNFLWVQNARPFQLIMGKFSSALIIAALLAALLVSLSCVPIVFHKDMNIDWLSVLALAVCYFIAYVCMCGVITLISTLVRTPHMAFWIAALFWVTTVFGPLLAAQAAKEFHPTPRDRDFGTDIQQQAQAPFWLGKAQYEEVAIYEAEVMTRHRALDANELGLNRDALVLQAHERFANRVYDRLYGNLYDNYERQESILRSASFFSPIFALQRISRGIARTDTSAQIHFAETAELHRRTIIEQLNEDMMYNAGEESFHYVADRELWQNIDDFEYESPPLNEVLQRYKLELTSLLLWTLLSFILAAVALHVRARSDVK